MTTTTRTITKRDNPTTAATPHAVVERFAKSDDGLIQKSQRVSTYASESAAYDKFMSLLESCPHDVEAVDFWIDNRFVSGFQNPTTRRRLATR